MPSFPEVSDIDTKLNDAVLDIEKYNPLWLFAEDMRFTYQSAKAAKIHCA